MAQERTNIFLPSTSAILLRRRYSARTMPAGHSLPPHSVSLVWRTSGGLRRPSNARVTCCDGLGIGEGTRSSDIDSSENSGAGSDVIDVDGRKGFTLGGSERERNGFRCRPSGIAVYGSVRLFSAVQRFEHKALWVVICESSIS